MKVAVRVRPRRRHVAVPAEPDASALFRDAAFFREVFRVSPVAMLVFNTRGPLVDANPACERLLGYTAKELRRAPFDVLAHPDDQHQIVEALQRVIDGGVDHVRIERRYVRKDGSAIWAQSAVAALRDAAGVVQHLVFFIEDITEYKRAGDALRESEARFRQLAENMEDGVWMATADFSEMLYVSPVLERMWGVTREELSANPLANRDFIHPDDRDRVLGAFLTAFEAPVEQRFRVVRRDGIVRSLRVRGIPIRDHEGRVYRIAGITEDVTDRQRAADALEDARRHAARLVQAVREPLGLLYKALAPGVGETESGRVETFAVRAARLTPRERQVAELLVAGRSTRAIAAALGISPKTVEVHRAQVMRKMAVRSVAELIRLALLGPGEAP